MKQDHEISVKSILMIFRKYAVLLICATLFCGFSSYVFSRFFITPEYQSKAVLIVDVNLDTTAAVTYDNMTVSQKLVDTYVVILRNDELLSQVVKKLNLNETPKQLAQSIQVKQVGTTAIIELSVQGSSPESAEKIANTIVELAPDEIARAVKGGSIEVIAPAQASSIPVFPDTKMITIIGLLAGLIIPFSAVLVKELLNGKFRTESDIEERLGFTVIGVIPDLNRIEGRR